MCLQIARPKWREPSRRRFWFGLLPVVLLAATLRLLSFDFSLPYIDHPDEPSLYVQALAWRGLADPIGNLAGYPPASIVQNILVQWVLEPLGYTGSASAVYANRLLSVLSGLLTLVFVALAARRIAGAWAGWLAGLAWAVSPLALEHGVYALADPHVYMLSAMTTWLAVVALLDAQRRHWVVWSTLAALLAVTFKYPAVFLLFPGGVVTLVLLRRDRRALRYLIVQAIMVGLVGAFFLFVYDATQMEMNVTQQAEGRLLANLLTPGRLLENLWSTIMPLNGVAWVIAAVAGVAAFFIARRTGNPTAHAGAVALCALAMAAHAWGVSSFTVMSENGRLRDILPGTPLAAVLFGTAVAQIGFALPRRLGKLRQAAPAIVVAALVFAPQFAASWALVQERQRPDQRIDLRAWADTNLDPGTVLVNQSNHKTFNPYFSGLQGRHWFDWWVVSDITERPVEEWRRRGMSYAALDVERWRAALETGAGRAYFDELLHLRTFDKPGAAGPRTAVFRLWRMQHETEIRFGDRIYLVGYDLDATQVRPGDSLELRFYWRAAATPEADYSLFIHLTASDEVAPLAQVDGAPARVERLTLTWDDPDETIISQPFSLTIPPELAAGVYAIRIGLYDYRTGERLPVTGTAGALADAYTLATIAIPGGENGEY
ncbi:MAG: glycosyltransferase family 39 protein [Chloroflexota bacterium]